MNNVIADLSSLLKLTSIKGAEDLEGRVKGSDVKFFYSFYFYIYIYILYTYICIESVVGFLTSGFSMTKDRVDTLARGSWPIPKGECFSCHQKVCLPLEFFFFFTTFLSFKSTEDFLLVII